MFQKNVVAMTLAAALAALPLRDRLQRSVNRLIDGDRDEPDRALRRLGRRLEASLDPQTVLPTLVGAVAEAMRSPYVAIEFERDHIYFGSALDYCPELLVKHGFLTRRRPTPAQWRDIRFGWMRTTPGNRFSTGFSVNTMLRRVTGRLRWDKEP